MAGSATPEGPVLAAVVGHLPPPVHGMAVAVARFAELLDRSASRAGGRCVRLSTVVSCPRGSPAYHLGRARRVLAAMWYLWWFRSQRPTVYVSCDAGPGMLYTAMLLAWTRVLGLNRWLHHHSYSYLDEPSSLFRGLLLVTGASTTHLVGCDDMAMALRSVSRRPLRIIELPIMYAVEQPQIGRTLSRRREPIVLGHLSNLSAEKGLRDVFTTLAALERSGVAAELVLAGPPATPGDAALLEELLEAAGDRVRYLGPVYGADREKFFDLIDVFLFPSHYRNESFGLVVGEALLRGVEVVAYERGCLSSALVGDAGLLLARTEPFAERASVWIQNRRPSSGQAEVAVAHERRAEAEAEAEAVAAQIIRRQLTENGPAPLQGRRRRIRRPVGRDQLEQYGADPRRFGSP